MMKHKDTLMKRKQPGQPFEYVVHSLFEWGLPYSALPKIISYGYKALHLQYFFTCGSDEVKAWTIMVSVTVKSALIHCPSPLFSKEQKHLRQLEKFTQTLRKVSSWQR